MTRNAVKRQKVATVQFVLFDPDVVFLLAALLDARELCQVSLTCKTLGGRHDGLSLVEEAARRQFECASEWERSCLLKLKDDGEFWVLKYDDEGWIQLYRHLLMLRSKLTFDQLVGAAGIQYGEDKSTVRACNASRESSSALCSNHVMRSGRHFAVFTQAGDAFASIGIVRPVQINKSDFDDGELDSFCPGKIKFWKYLKGKQTERWGASNAHCCAVTAPGCFYWHDWICMSSRQPILRPIDSFQTDIPIGLLLDLDEGTLSIYQNGQRMKMLKDGLSGVYCWYATAFNASFDSTIETVTISVERSSAPDY